MDHTYGDAGYTERWIMIQCGRDGVAGEFGGKVLESLGMESNVSTDIMGFLVSLSYFPIQGQSPAQPRATSFNDLRCDQSVHAIHNQWSRRSSSKASYRH